MPGLLPPGRDCLFILALVALVWCTNAIWLAIDSRPPVWDMAMHQSYALNYIPGGGSSLSPGPPWSRSGVYPPFVHILMALCYLAFRPGPDVAVLANLPATALLFWAVYILGSELAGRCAGRWAVLITAMTPFLFWMSRETILDYWLSAWAAAGLVILRRTNGFERRNHSILLGIILALGFLTKWLFAVFLIFPVLVTIVVGRLWRHPGRLQNFGIAALICCLVAGIWYIPNLATLMRYFPENARIGAIEGEPPVLSFQSFIYYVRLLEGYQLFAPLSLLLAVSSISVLRRGLLRDARFLIVAVAGAWLALTLIRTKDPRFTMPLLGLLSIIPAAWIQSWRKSRASTAAKALMLSVLSFQAYAINFGVSWLPKKVVLAEGFQGSLRWDWNLYLQDYFDILGQPRHEDWRHSDILTAMQKDAVNTGLRPNVGLVPDLPWFCVANFDLCARLLNIRAGITRLVLTERGIYPLQAVDYVVTAEGEQGMSWTTTTSKDLNRIVEKSPLFQLVERFSLPQGNFARLYRVSRENGTGDR